MNNDGEMATIDFYNNTIAPYKGSLEIWFVSNKSLYIYFVAIFITIWAVINPKSKIAWKLFSNLPKPPKELRTPLNYS